MTKRLDGKEMLGCWVSSDLIRAITEWRQRKENQGKSKTDFVVAAALEKLEAENIPHDRAMILLDGRSKLQTPDAKTITSGRADARASSVASGKAHKLAKEVLKRATDHPKDDPGSSPKAG
jgi:hypothetical protein